MVVKRGMAVILPLCAALPSIGAGETERWVMMLSFARALTAMAAVSAILCVFSIAWAAFVLMAEGAESKNAARARNAVCSALVGLALTLSARTVLAILISAAQSP